jgi:HAT1-interacting factor 1
MAFEILDMARVLFTKRLEENAEKEGEGKGKDVSEGDSPEIRHVKERLADTHDLIAEVSLENERFVSLSLPLVLTATS